MLCESLVIFSSRYIDDSFYLSLKKKRKEKKKNGITKVNETLLFYIWRRKMILTINRQPFVR